MDKYGTIRDHDKFSVRLYEALIHNSKVGHSLKKVRDVWPIGECGTTLSTSVT